MHLRHSFFEITNTQVKKTNQFDENVMGRFWKKYFRVYGMTSGMTLGIHFTNFAIISMSSTGEDQNFHSRIKLKPDC